VTGVTVRHPLNPASEIEIRMLSRATGMQRLGVSHATVPPGKESLIYHSHTTEEEFMYILSGTGTLRAGADETEIGPGDIVGFATPSIAHTVVNSGNEPLVYLVGGESKELEQADFPDQGKRLFRSNSESALVDVKDIKNLFDE
jgi:uncharacterized cupin superfamily protein